MAYVHGLIHLRLFQIFECDGKFICELLAVTYCCSIFTGRSTTNTRNTPRMKSKVHYHAPFKAVKKATEHQSGPLIENLFVGILIYFVFTFAMSPVRLTS